MLELKVDGFSGPLDLLLDLIEREKLDITTLSLAQVADQYWQHVESQEDLEPDALADFILIGSKLLYVKSCALLPSASPPKEELRLDEGVAAAELASMVEEYKRFRDAAAALGELEEKGQHAYTRPAPGKEIPLPPGLQGVTVDTLMQAVQEALSRKPPEPEQAVLEIEPVTVDEKIGELSLALERSRGRLPFRRLLHDCETRTEIVVLFLAVLEMIKVGRLWAEQDRPFGDITLVETAAEPA
ncbi:MAG: segregation/condensation protein A [Chloroflexi bacterium]|nr:segregation/condensation protein A [Chloroflexota bacterium]